MNDYFVACVSGGKDSIATVELALDKGLPLDEIIFVQTMFDDTIPAIYPEHLDFILNVIKPRYENLGIKFTILKPIKNYISCFNHIVTRSKDPKRNGKKCGYLIPGKCLLSRDGKVNTITEYLKQLTKEQNFNIVQYVGIACDEPERLERLHKTNNKKSVLEHFKYSQVMCYKLCKERHILSHIYKTNTRDGCWFCPHKSVKEFATIKLKYPELYNALKNLKNTENLITPIFKEGMTFDEFDCKVDTYNKTHIKKLW